MITLFTHKDKHKHTHINTPTEATAAMMCWCLYLSVLTTEACSIYRIYHLWGITWIVDVTSLNMSCVQIYIYVRVCVAGQHGSQHTDSISVEMFKFLWWVLVQSIQIRDKCEHLNDSTESWCRIFSRNHNATLMWSRQMWAEILVVPFLTGKIPLFMPCNANDFFGNGPYWKCFNEGPVAGSTVHQEPGLMPS